MLGLTEHLAERLPFNLSRWAPSHFLFFLGPLHILFDMLSAMFFLSSLSLTHPLVLRRMSPH